MTEPPERRPCATIHGRLDAHPSLRRLAAPLLLTAVAACLPVANAAPNLIDCWGSVYEQAPDEHWEVGVLLPFLVILGALGLNAFANLTICSGRRRKLATNVDRPLWGRGRPATSSGEPIMRSWLWISGLPLLPLFVAAAIPWILFNYTPADRCSIGLAARIWIGPSTVTWLSIVMLCILPIVVILNVLIQQQYPHKRFAPCGYHPPWATVRLLGKITNKLVAFTVVVWCMITWSALAPTDLTLVMVVFPVFLLFLRHAARLMYRCHETPLDFNALDFCAAVLLQPGVYLRMHNAFLWLLIVLLTCLNFLDSLRGTHSDRATAVLALQILTGSALSIDVPQLKNTMAAIVFPEELVAYDDALAWTEDLNAMLVAHQNEINAHNALKPVPKKYTQITIITEETTTSNQDRNDATVPRGSVNRTTPVPQTRGSISPGGAAVTSTGSQALLSPSHTSSVTPIRQPTNASGHGGVTVLTVRDTNVIASPSGAGKVKQAFVPSD